MSDINKLMSEIEDIKSNLEICIAMITRGQYPDEEEYKVVDVESTTRAIHSILPNIDETEIKSLVEKNNNVSKYMRGIRNEN